MSGALDLSQVQWDPAPAAGGIDLSQVKWDPSPDEAAQAEADAIRMPERFQKRAGRPDPIRGPSLPTTDEARAALEPAPNTVYGEILPLARDTDASGAPVGSPRFAMPGIVRNTLLGALDIGQGRAQMDEAGNPLSIRPTPNALAALSLGAGITPAARTGRAIAETAENGAPLADLYSRNRLLPNREAPAPVAPVVAAPVAAVERPPAPVAAAPEPAPAPMARMEIKPDGNTVYLPSGREVPVRYEVVDAATLRTSNLADGAPNPNFPPEMQPRDRSRAASEMQISRMSNSLQPERLGRSSSAMDGAPIVGPDGIVESGNGRTIAIIRAYERGDQNAAAYRDYLTKQGFDTTGMERPVLVRRRDGEMAPADRARFAQEANAEQGLAMGAAERAQIDASRLDDETLNLFRGGDPASAANADFVRAFVRNVAEPGQEGALATGGGSLSVEGANRLRAALTQRAYGDSKLVASLAEAGDENIKAFGGALMDAAGPMAKLAGDIKAGRVDPAVDIAPSIAKAVEVVRTAREKRVSIAEVVGQRDAFGGGADAQAEELLRAAYGPDLKGRMNRAAFARTVENYARLAGEQQAGPRLFGENLGWKQILAEAGGKIERPAGPPQNSLMPLTRQAAEPVPESVGAAATPRMATNMTPAEAQASRSQGEMRTLMEAPRPGDTTEYVPGIKPTRAELELQPTVSREAKTMRMEKPEPWTERDLANNDIYQDFFDDLAKTPTLVNRAKEARAAQAEADLRAAWGSKAAADPTPVFTHIEGVKSGPDGRRAAVENVMGSVSDRLLDAKGQPITDPEMLYGVRKHISDMVSREAKRSNADAAVAEALLLDVRAALDEVIEAAAPGYRNYLTNYAEASKPIDVMTLLQDAKPAITSGADRMIQFARFDRLMRDLVSDRAAGGVNKAKSIDDATWEKLVAMHKSLQRTAYARQLAQAAGSDTTQNLYDLAKKGSMVAGHAALGATTYGVGNVALSLIARGMRESRAKNQLMRHLDPDVSKYPNQGP